MADHYSIKVLIIEDEPMVRDVMAAGLRINDYVVALADNGQQGLAALQEERPDVVLLDLRLPDMDGIEVLRAIKQSFTAVPVIIVSGRGTIEDAIQAMRLGAADFILKPVTTPVIYEESIIRALATSAVALEQQETQEKLLEKESRLHHLAYYDALTNLPNRVLFHDRLQQMMIKARRTGKQVALLFLDLDRFQQINKTLGHDVGDRLLQEVAERLRNYIRKSDTVVRLGGDEFALIIDDIKNHKDVSRLARKVLELLAKVTMVDSYELYITSSIGISLFPEDSEEAEGLMRCAETAMYRAKESGKNNYQFYTADMNTRALELLLLETGLRKALENHEFVVHYQPQFDLSSRRLIGMEALLRWRHPARGMISPADFIPLAEETGLIVPIGEWVMKEACAQNKAWQDAGYQQVKVAVNMSGLQFRQESIAKTVARVLAETKLAPQYMELEVTESMIMGNAEATIATLNELKQMGVRLSIDDFGTGYSSLSYLKLFPIDNLKIDRSFIKNINYDENDAMIADSIIALAHSMNLSVIAEGVEEEAQLQLLQEKNCDAVQGFFTGRPVPAEDFVDFFNSQPGAMNA
jgi:diguanylate cyclase (GGDEF)-like protein